MSVLPSLGSAGNLLGPDFIVIFAVAGLIVVGVATFVLLLVRRAAVGPSGGSHAERLQKLEALRSSGAISQTEYDEQRRRVLGEL